MLHSIDRASARNRLGEEETTPILHNNSSHTEGTSMAQRGIIVGVTLATTLALLLIVTAAARSGQDHASIRVTDETLPTRSPDTRLSFFVVGDWGFGGTRLQPQSARLMNELSHTLKPDFVISAGDNFYPNGMLGKDDPKFRERFSQMYSADGLQVPWYAVLGNHDYGDGSHEDDAEYLRCKGRTWEECASNGCCGSPVWQYTEHRELDDQRWHLQNGTYRKSFLDGALDIIFIDTTPFITRHRCSVWEDNLGGLRYQNTTQQKLELESLLKASSEGPAMWRVLVGHHGVRSYGHHCTEDLNKGNVTEAAINCTRKHGLAVTPSDLNQTDCQAMAWLAPLLQKYQVQLSLAGHDHDMQHIKFPNETTHYVVSGGGGDRRPGEFDGIDAPHAQFLDDNIGFAVVDVGQDLLNVTLYTVEGGLQPAHTVQVWASSGTGGRRLRALEDHDLL